MVTVFVTGGSGFIASHTVKLLLEKGYKVRTSVRNLDDPRAKFLREWGVEIVVGNLLQEEGWSENIKGCEYVIHMASPFKTQVKDPVYDLHEPAINGVKNVLNGVKDSGCVKKVVLTSSVASIMCGHTVKYLQENELNEKIWTDKENLAPGYEMSKTLAEEKAWYLAKKFGIEMDAVCPGLVIGPLLAEHHKDCQSSVEIMGMLGQPGVPMITIPVVDVRDVAKVHVAAMERKESGERYIAVSDQGQDSTLPGLCAYMNQANDGITTKRAPTWVAPSFLVRILGYFDAQAATVKPYLYKLFKISNQKSKDVLKVDYLPLVSGFKSHLESLVEYGSIPSVSK